MSVTQIVRKLHLLENKPVTVKLTPHLDESIKGASLSGTLNFDERKDLWGVTSGDGFVTFDSYDVNQIKENSYKNIEIHIVWASS